MIKPNESQIRSLVSLSGDINWECFVGWLEESLKEQAIANSTSSGEITIKNQGRCLELKEILNHISNTSNYLQNIRENDILSKGGLR